jgi:hypothetical protein
MIAKFPRRPDVTDERANRILDWVDTVAYVFWVVFLIVLAVLAVIHGANLIDLKPIHVREFGTRVVPSHAAMTTAEGNARRREWDTTAIPCPKSPEIARNPWTPSVAVTRKTPANTHLTLPPARS